MSGGYRGIIAAAIFGLAIVAFGTGAYLTSLTYPKQDRYQPYGSTDQDKAGTALVGTDASPAPKRKTPCANPQTEGESDLCAQWRAARAAEKSADWTKWGVLASIVGISFLLWQIMLTREAVKDTRDATLAMIAANEISKDGMKRQLRAYLSLSQFNWETDRKDYKVQIVWINSGQTPARQVRCNATWAAFDNPIDETFDFPLPPYLLEDGSANVGMGKVILGTCEEDLPPHMATKAALGRANVYVWGRVDYVDVFDEPHYCNVAVKMECATLPEGMMVVRWNTVHRHNEAD